MANFKHSTVKNDLQAFFLSVTILCGSLPSILNAQQGIDIKANGFQQEIAVSDPNTKTVFFKTTSKGNSSHFVTVNANGPSGIKGYVEVRQISRGGKLGPLSRLSFPKKKKGFTTELTDGSSQSLVATEFLKAAAVGYEPSAEEVARVRTATGLSETVIKILFKGGMTEAEIIARYSKGSNSNTPIATPTPYGTPTANIPGTLSGKSLLSKDACDQSAAEYQITFFIDLSGVDRIKSGNSFKVKGSIEFGEAKASPASLKPVSDGKFAPRPLILMSSVGYSYYNSGGATLRLVRWKNGRPGKTTPLTIEDYVYYRGQSLARSIATSVLTGGKGTFEISNGDAVGSACFNLVRTRQRVNGYQGGD